MSTPRSLQTVDEILDAARAHGFIVKPDGAGHHRILQRRDGEGPPRTVTTCPSTSINYHNLKNVVARVKKETGIDIRSAPPARPRLAPEPEPEPTPTIILETPSDANLRRIVREEIDALLDRFAKALAPDLFIPAPKEPEPTVELPPVVRVMRKKQRPRLTEKEKQEIASLFASGERMADIERTYNLGHGVGYLVLKGLGAPAGRKRA